MTRFVDTLGSDTASINKLADICSFLGQRTVVAKTGATSTLTAAEMVQSIVGQSGTNGALSISTATAAAIVALIPNAQVGSHFSFTINNANDNTMTLTAGTGITLVGTTAVPTNKSQTYSGIVTNATAGAEAVTIYGTLTAAA